MCFEPCDLTHTTDLHAAILSLSRRFFLNAIRYNSPAPIILASNPDNPPSEHTQAKDETSCALSCANNVTSCQKQSKHTTDLKRAVKQNTHALHQQIY